MILSPVLRQRFLDSNGNPLAGGKLYSYAAGTTTPQATYTDQSGGTPNTNPVILDANGYADVWLDPVLAYKFLLKDSSDVVQWTVDQVSGEGTSGVGGWNATANYSQGDIVQDASGSGLLYVSLQNSNLGNALSSVAYWRLFGGAIRTVTADTTLAVTDDLIRSNSTSGNLTHTLPACSSTPIGKRITVKDVGTGGHTTSVKGNGTDQVDGAVTYATALNAKVSCTFENNGTSWDVVTGAAIPDGAVSSTAKMADGIVTQSKLATRTTGTTVAAGGVAISASSGSFSTASTTLADITNMSVTITTTGRPVVVSIVTDNTSSGNTNGFAAGGSSGTQGAAVAILRGSTVLTIQNFGGTTASTINTPGYAQCIDTPAAGTYTYKAQAMAVSGTQTSAVNVKNCILLAYEI